MQEHLSRSAVNVVTDGQVLADAVKPQVLGLGWASVGQAFSWHRFYASPRLTCEFSWFIAEQLPSALHPLM